MTTLSIAPSSVPRVEINFMSQGLVVTFEQKNYTSDAYLATHYSNVTMSIYRFKSLTIRPFV